MTTAQKAVAASWRTRSGRALYAHIWAQATKQR